MFEKDPVALCVDFVEQSFKLGQRAGDFGFGGSVAIAGLFQRHVEFKDLFKQFGRNVLSALFADVEAFTLQDVLGSGHRVAEHAPGVVERR